MPGRRRIKVRGRASAASAAQFQSRADALLRTVPDVHRVERQPERRPPRGSSVDGLDRLSMDIRFSRSADAPSSLESIKALAAGLPDSEFEIEEHECFHGLEDEPDYKPCSATLRRDWIDDGSERPGPNRDPDREPTPRPGRRRRRGE